MTAHDDMNEYVPVCPSCGTEGFAGQRFCESCGAKYPDPARCPQCGQLRPPDEKFCGACGAPMQPAPAEAAQPVPGPAAPEPEAKPAAEPKAPGPKPEKPAAAPAPSPVSMDTIVEGMPERKAGPEKEPAAPAPAPATPAPAKGPSPVNIKVIGGIVAVIVVIAVIWFAVIPLMQGGPSPAAADGNSGTGPTTPAASADGSVQPSATGTPSLVPGPIQAVPKGTEVYFQTEKSPINAIVTVRFTGGPGQNVVMDNRVILTRSDGVVVEGKIDFSQILSEVNLQGTKGTDRLQFIITQHSGKSYTLFDDLMPYRSRG